MKKIDIIIPALNQIEYTKKCLVYLKANTHIPFRIIFIDNASTDGTSEFVENFCKMNGVELKLIKNKENAGVAKSWNQGLKVSDSEYIAIINNDIIPSPNWLKNIIDVMKNDGNIWCGCPVFTVGEMPDSFPDNMKLSNTMIKANKLIGFCFVLSRTAIDTVGLFDEQFKIGWFEDSCLWVRLAMAGHPPMIINDSYIHHFGSITIKAFKGFSKYAEENARKFKRKYGGDKEQVLAKFSDDTIIIEEDIKNEEDIPTQTMELKEAFKISVPTNYTPEQNTKIPVGDFKYFDIIPAWAKDNVHYYIEKVKIEVIPEVSVQETPIKEESEKLIPKYKQEHKQEHKPDHKIVEVAQHLLDNFTMEELPAIKKNKVEIILVRFNLKEVEDEAIRLVKENTKFPYKLTVVNNYKKNIELSKLWNGLIKKSKCKYVCLLNSDAFVTKGWLTKMMGAFNDNQVAAVGPSGDKIGGVQRRIGIEEDAETLIGKFKKIRHLSGFCLVLRKDYFQVLKGFPKEVPFYGGESAWCVKARKAGYKLLWGQGSFVYHKHGASAKKAGLWDKMRTKGIQQYAKWVAKTSPVLFTVHNRLEYTKKSLQSLLKSECENIVIVDNASDEATKKYLKKMFSSNKNKIKKLISNKENLGIAGTMNMFFETTEEEEFIGKVDNDTIVPKKWFSTLISANLEKNFDVLQAKCQLLSGNHKTFADLVNDSEILETTIGGRIIKRPFVGGSGIAIKRENIKTKIPKQEWILGGWTNYQTNYKLKCGFYDGIETNLLDMEDDNKMDTSKYPEYYKKTRRLKEEQKQEIKQEVNKEVIPPKENFKVLSTGETMLDIIAKINTGDRFAFTRWGDGELLMLDGFKGKAVTQFNSPKFQNELKEAFLIDDTDYLISVSAGMQNEPKAREGLFASFSVDEQIKDIVKKYRQDDYYYSPTVFHYLLCFNPYAIKIFFKELEKKKIGFVGGHLISDITKYINISEYYTIPPYQAYDSIDEYYKDINEMAKRVDIILIAAGPTANVIQKRLWETAKNTSTIDIGSIASALADNKEDLHTWIRKAKNEIELAKLIIKE